MPSITSPPAIPLSGTGISVSRPETTRVEDALRRSSREARVGGFLPRLQRYGTDDQADNDNAASAADGGSERRTRARAPAPSVAADSHDSAPFLAQVIGQDETQPKETSLDPFGEASQAYAQRGGPDTSLVLDTPMRVDFSV